MGDEATADVRELRPTPASLTPAQASRRQRVIRAALDLAAEGGYDAVQMRDVSARADVALGTIYRYFSSKDHLLAAALVEWAIDLERNLQRRPPEGATTVDRLIDILRRGTSAMELQPHLTSAVITALFASDPDVAECQREVSLVLERVQAAAFDGPGAPEVDAVTRDDIIRTLGHVWMSALVGWVNGWLGAEKAGDELELAVHLLLDHR